MMPALRNQCDRKKTYIGDGGGEEEGKVKWKKTTTTRKKHCPQKNHISLGKEPQEHWYRLNGLET